MQDVASAFGPDEWLGFGVVVGDVFIDGADQFGNAGKDASTQALGRDVAEESLNHVSHDADVGVKCILKRGCFSSHA